jgi:hypothetical protein
MQWSWAAWEGVVVLLRAQKCSRGTRRGCIHLADELRVYSAAASGARSRAWSCPSASTMPIAMMPRAASNNSPPL